MNHEALLQKLSLAVQECDVEKTREVAIEVLKAGINPIQAIEEGLAGGVRIIGDKFAIGEAFLPELIMAGEAMKAGVEVFRPEIMKRKLERKSLGKIVIGTVKGDLHDIGKNIVIAMLEAAGFEVFDLGVDVPAERFVHKVEEVNADILGMSALLTVTLPEQKTVVEALKKAGLRDKVKVMIGGAAVTPEWAKGLGVDGYADNAVAAVRRVKEILGV